MTVDPERPHRAAPMDLNEPEQCLCRYCGARVRRFGFAGWFHEDHELDLPAASRQRKSLFPDTKGGT